MMKKKEYISPAVEELEVFNHMCAVPIGNGSATVIGAKSYEYENTTSEKFEDAE